MARVDEDELSATVTAWVSDRTGVQVASFHVARTAVYTCPGRANPWAWFPGQPPARAVGVDAAAYDEAPGVWTLEVDWRTQTSRWVKGTYTLTYPRGYEVSGRLRRSLLLRFPWITCMLDVGPNEHQNMVLGLITL